MKVAVLYNHVPQGASKDEEDVLLQIEAVCQALSDLGFETLTISLSLNLELTIDALQKTRPEIVFNLVESVDSQGQLIQLAPAILDRLRLPYTGSNMEALFLTSNKLLAKKLLKASGVLTPTWISLESTPGDAVVGDAVVGDAVIDGDLYIIKSIWEHASIGLDNSSIIAVRDGHQLHQEMKRRNGPCGQHCFAEAYIEGREFNLSLLEDDRGPQVLPPAEIQFEAYPSEKFKIVDYRAKWEEESFEYQHTHRCFEFPEGDNSLLRQLDLIARRCWHIFELRGYARVDLRIDQAGRPWVLEVNANPCLSPGSGFVAATRQAGLSFPQVVERIMKASYPD